MPGGTDGKKGIHYQCDHNTLKDKGGFFKNFYTCAQWWLEQ